jgi:hypothetical protein
MSVNLIQIQERLKDVPMQSIMQYANGGNPQVPPFMALSELNRRKQMQQNAQPAQAPQGTVKDHIEQEVAGMAGMPGPGQMPGQPPQGQAPQGMPQGAPQGMPQGAPQMAPPQAPPVRAAEGGLMSLPVRDFEFGSGGIVAFAGSGQVDDDDETEDGEETLQDSLSVTNRADTKSMTPNADLQQYKAMMEQRLAERTPRTLSPLQMEKKLAKEDPEQYAILRAKPGAEYMQGIEAQLQARNSEAEKQRAENAKLKELQTYGLLAKAANSTRGMTGGIGSQIAQMLGTFGQGYAGVEEKATAQEQALREDLLKRQELKNAAQFEVEKLQRARAEGDVKAEYGHMASLAKLQNALSVSQNGLLKGAISGAYGMAGKQYAADVAAKAKVEAATKMANARTAAAYAPGDKEKLLARVQKLRADGKTDEAEALIKDYAALGGTAGASGSERNLLRQLSDERAAYQNVINNVNGKFTAEEIAEAKAGLQEVMKEMAAVRTARKPKEEEVKPIQVESYDLPDTPTEANLVNGRVYKTPKGDLRWNAATKKMVATQ